MLHKWVSFVGSSFFIYILPQSVSTTLYAMSCYTEPCYEETRSYKQGVAFQQSKCFVQLWKTTLGEVCLIVFAQLYQVFLQAAERTMKTIIPFTYIMATVTYNVFIRSTLSDRSDPINVFHICFIVPNKSPPFKPFFLCPLQWRHSAMASQIIGASIVCSTVSLGADKKKYIKATRH